MLICPTPSSIQVWTPKSYDDLVVLGKKVRLKAGIHVYINTECGELGESILKIEVAKALEDLGGKRRSHYYFSYFGACGVEPEIYQNPDFFLEDELLKKGINCIVTRTIRDTCLFSITGNPLIVIRVGETTLIRPVSLHQSLTEENSAYSLATRIINYLLERLKP